MKQLSVFFIFVLLLFSVFSCKKDVPAIPHDFGYNYFPDELGRYVVYDVDSFFYDTKIGIKDSFKFRLKEKIDSIYFDNENRSTIRLARYVKIYNSSIPYNAMEWILKDVWIENKTSSTAEKVEENIRFIKLAFPVNKTQVWNGNAQNTFKKWDYKYGFIDLPNTVGNIHFDSVLQVNQYDDNNAVLIKRQYYYEKYARNVGMIYKQVIDVKSQPDSTLTASQLQEFYRIPILQRITYGTYYTMTVNSYGIE